jgi:hypothetical protein
LKKEQDVIKTHIDGTRDKWDSLDTYTQMKIWKDVQILLKLSEKYIEFVSR